MVWQWLSDTGEYLGHSLHNMAIGAGNTLRETADDVRDVGAVGTDAVTTSTGNLFHKDWSLGVQNWSQVGKSYEHPGPDYWKNAGLNADARGLHREHSAVARLSLVRISTQKTGDADAYQRHVGGVAAGNGLTVLTIKGASAIKAMRAPSTPGAPPVTGEAPSTPWPAPPVTGEPSPIVGPNGWPFNAPGSRSQADLGPNGQPFNAPAVVPRPILGPNWSSRSMRGSRSQADSAPEWLAVQSAGSRSQADLWTEWCGVRRADGRSNSSGIHKNAGWSDEKIPSHLEGIDFNQPVEVVTLPKGTKVVQYQIPGNPTGNYFAPAGTSAESLGMNSAGRVATIYTVLRDVTVLRLTAANTAANPNLPASVRALAADSNILHLILLPLANHHELYTTDFCTWLPLPREAGLQERSYLYIYRRRGSDF